MIKNKKLIFIIAVLSLLAIGALVYIFVIKDDHKSSRKTTNAVQENKVNLDPPTEEDNARVEKNKQRIVEQQNSQSNTPISSVKPVITYAEQYQSNVEVSGYVNGIFEDGGICTAKFTQGSLVVTMTSVGIKNSNNVSCPAIMTPVSNFSQKGSWFVTLSYNSAKASGSSDQRIVEIK